MERGANNLPRLLVQHLGGHFRINLPKYFNDLVDPKKVWKGRNSDWNYMLADSIQITINYAIAKPREFFFWQIVSSNRLKSNLTNILSQQLQSYVKAKNVHNYLQIYFIPDLRMSTILLCSLKKRVWMEVSPMFSLVRTSPDRKQKLDSVRYLKVWCFLFFISSYIVWNSN